MEDNAVNRLVTTKMLERLGCDTNAAENSQIALEMSAVVNYDVIFMDCQMPLLDGYNTTHVIRTRASDRHIPIVAMTANALVGDREKYLDAGMDDYISKPINRVLLEQVLNR